MKLNEQQGFTLVELIIILVLIGILSYTAISEFTNSTLSFKTIMLANKIVVDVRYAQEMAMSHGKKTEFLVESSQNKYTLKWENGSYLKIPIGGRDFVYDIDDSDFVGVGILSSGFTQGLLAFDSEGRPYNNGSLLSSETMLISLSGNIHIKIVPGTGRCYKQVIQ